MSKPTFINLSIKDMGVHTRINVASIVYYYDYKPGHAVMLLVSGQLLTVEDISSVDIDALIAVAFEHT
jgi:hypothetical protein